MQRRSFLQLAAAAPALGGSLPNEPTYKTVSRFQPASVPGMPGRYPGLAVRTHCRNFYRFKYG